MSSKLTYITSSTTNNFFWQIKGNIAIQMGSNPTYITALDDGSFTVGPPHDEG